MTTVYVTHDQVEAMTLGDRVVVMRDGVHRSRSTRRSSSTISPANLFVAGFIGSPAMNFVSGILRREGSGAVVVAADGTRLPAPDGVGRLDENVVYGIRPEHFTLSSAGVGVPARVEVIEPTGANIEVISTLAGERVCASFTERHAMKPGETIHLAPRLDKVHLFDAATSQRI